jgi:hypothetical protein
MLFITEEKSSNPARPESLSIGLEQEAKKYDKYLIA